jgi:hypothetical protein
LRVAILQQATQGSIPEREYEGRFVVTERDPAENVMMADPDEDSALGRDENGPIFKAPPREEGEDDGSES